MGRKHQLPAEHKGRLWQRLPLGGQESESQESGAGTLKTTWSVVHPELHATWLHAIPTHLSFPKPRARTSPAPLQLSSPGEAFVSLYLGALVPSVTGLATIPHLTLQSSAKTLLLRSKQFPPPQLH